MTNEQLNQVGFIVTESGIEEISYKNYLLKYGKDETTTPRGIGDRMHIRERNEGLFKHIDTGAEIWESEYDNLDPDEQDNYKWYGEDTKEWQAWTWGVGGNHPQHCGPDFDNAEDAELYYYDRCEWYVREKNWNAPQFYDTEAEADNCIIEAIAADEDIDIEVAKHIYRKRKIVNAIREERRKIRHEQFLKEQKERKTYLSNAVPAEAEIIVIDQQFIDDLKAITGKNGSDKSNKHAAAFKALLQRNNKEKIESDFWQVFRILKQKAGN